MDMEKEGPAAVTNVNGAERQLAEYAREVRELRRSERSAREQVGGLQRAVAAGHAQQLAIIADLKPSHEAERRHAAQVLLARESMVQALVAAAEARDPYTGEHLDRVRRLSFTLGKRLGLAGAALEDLHSAAALHDLGHIGLPDAILLARTALENADDQRFQQHPLVGAAIIRTMPLLAGCADAVAAHHERWDGLGYPAGLKGGAIPIAARIIAVADAFDVRTTDRGHRHGHSTGAAVDEIARGAGTLFDPAVVAAFLQDWKGAPVA